MATSQAAAAAPPAASEGLASRLGAKVRKWKDIAKKAQEDSAASKLKIDELTKQVTDLTGKADGNEAAKQRDKISADFRQFKHELKFKEMAKAAGATSDGAIKDLLQLSGYKAESEEPDEKAIGSLLEAQKKERGYLFGTPGNEQAQGDGFRPGPASGKGNSDKDNQGMLVVTRQQYNDPVWMKNNASNIQRAVAENRFALDNGSLTR
jgi:hypothetical protein